MACTILLIKNMVCRRCLMAVEQILKNASIPFQKALIGEIYLKDTLTEEQRAVLSSQLSIIGLELIDNQSSGLIERMKRLVLLKARSEIPEGEADLNLSTYLMKHLFHEYTYLSSLFSEVEGRTIENYYIRQRIERVKELLVYNEMTIAAIALEMNYSSAAHLSFQFKQITGLTPSHFKKIGLQKRKLIKKE